MTDFCKRLLVVAVGALAFAGASYAQDITACATTTPATTPGPLNLRAEGTEELVGDILFTCTNTGAPTATGAVTTFLSGPVTSRALPAPATTTEATLFICTSLANCQANPPVFASTVEGTASGNTASFVGVSFPGATFWGRIANVRINANAVTLSATLTTVTEQVLASANGTSGATSSTTAVGYIFKSLVAAALVPNPNGNPTPTVTPYTTCVGNPLPTVGNLTPFSFIISEGEVFGGAFKAQVPDESGVDGTPGEVGSYGAAQGAPANVGTANFGTRVQVVFANVTAGQTIYVPVTLATSQGLTLQLTSTPNTAFNAVTASTATGAPIGGGFGNIGGGVGEGFGASAAFTPTNGTLTVVYEVTDAPAANILGFWLPVWDSFSKTQYTTNQGPLTVTVSYAPLGAQAAATTVPNFNGAGVTLTGTAINVCATDLLFPFVTNGGGFDSGIVIANTSTDPFGTTPAPGACTLNFYGTGAPSGGTAPAPGGSQASGTTNAFLLSGVAPGFTGYVIATCNFQFGYGYVFIEYGLGTSSGLAEGYIAPNITPRPAGGLAIIGQ